MTKIHCHHWSEVAKIEVPDESLSYIHVDLLHPFPSDCGYSYLSTTIDGSTHWLEMVTLETTMTDV